MRIGVITFFGNGNYGSELQALATKGFCESRGHEVTFLRIYSSNRLVRYFKKIINRFSVWYHCKTDKEYQRVYHDLHLNTSSQKGISSDLRNYIQLKVSELIKTDNISIFSMRHGNLYDCFICGSDQVWSALIQPVWTHNFLKGVSPDRKIAYAPSVGVDCVPNYYIKTITPLVKDFKYLSVREQSIAALFQNKIGVTPKVVVDPTILVGKEYWEVLLQKENIIRPKYPYILCYFLGELNDAQAHLINEFAEGRKIITLPYKDSEKILNNSQYVLANHLEFINYIQYADFVFTDSFHGMVFSLMFNKEFAVFNRSHIGITKQTSRIESLLNMVGLSERLVDYPKTIDSFSSIDYKIVNTIIEHKRQDSICFLDSALKEVAKHIK